MTCLSARTSGEIEPFRWFKSTRSPVTELMSDMSTRFPSTALSLSLGWLVSSGGRITTGVLYLPRSDCTRKLGGVWEHKAGTTGVSNLTSDKYSQMLWDR